MRLCLIILLCVWLPFFAVAQNGTISGKVTSKETKSAVPRASVFLSNSSFGTISSADGNFALNNLRPGQYTLTVNALGYSDYTKVILVGDEPIKLNIELEPKIIQLREVVISSTSAADWRRNYAEFKEEFIGTDANAKICDVINPKILYFTYHKTQQVLEAESDEFLIVDNRALGYRVKFLLRSFKCDRIAGITSYGGERLFEELPGNAAQKKRWKQNRDLAYYGSAMHFYRSLYTDKLKEEGFEARRFTRVPNPNRPEQAVILRMLNMYRLQNKRDSFNHWVDVESYPKYIHEKVANVPWFSFELLRTAQQPGIFAVTFPDYLYVMYLRKREEMVFKDVYRPLDMPNYETSIINLTPNGNPPYALFDKNGIIIDNAPMYEGTWSKSRLSELLPVDYVPSDKH